MSKQQQYRIRDLMTECRSLRCRLHEAETEIERLQLQIAQLETACGHLEADQQ